MKKYLLALVLIFIIFTAGCIGEREPKVSKTDGLVINQFVADASRIMDDQSNVFMLEIENVGGTTAKNITASLYGVSSWSGDLESETDEEMKPPDITLEPPMPGDLKMFSWDLEAPALPEGIIHPYIVKGRIRYDYKTTAAINIPGYSRREYRRRVEQGKGTLETVAITNTKGFEGSGGAPIKMDISPKNVIRFDRDGGDEIYSYRLIITNVGNGVPIGKNDQGQEEDGIITGRAEIAGPAEFKRCFGNEPENGKINIRPDDLKLMRSGEKTTVCEINILSREWGDAPEKTVSLTVRLSYEYYTEKSLTVKVVGQGLEE